MKGTLIGLTIFLFTLKFIIQTHLDYKHQRFKEFTNPNMAFSCMLPCIEPVKQKLEKERNL